MERYSLGAATRNTGRPRGVGVVNLDRDRPLGIWLLTCCALVFAMVVLGGVTRLTHSGLSMVEWDPIMGVVPPITEHDWQQTFLKYQQYPEYQQTNRGMRLEEFKFIFFLEYAHRMLGRIIALAFLVPFLVFLFLGRIRRALAPKLIAMFVLGAMQGVLGWYMVMSGLVDEPRVSQYRLTAHLVAAFAIYAYMFWVALDLLRPHRPGPLTDRATGVRRMAWLITAFIALTVVSGGFVAGTRAGFAFNTYPLMNGEWIPDSLYALTPVWVNFFENIATVQFNHRWLATALFVAVCVFWLWSRSRALHFGARLAVHALLAAAILQFGLGLATLLYVVPTALAAAHQGGALLLFTAALVVNHELRSAGEIAPGYKRKSLIS